MLLAGEDSTAAHTALHHAKAALQEVRAAERAAAEAATAEAAAARQQDEAEALQRAQQEHAQAVAAMALPEGVEAPAEALPQAVVHALAGVQRAKAAFDRARAAQAEAAAPRDRVAGRLAQAREELDSIGARRATGDVRDGDEARIKTLDLDVKHLAAALAPLETTLAVVAEPVAAAQHALQAAEHALADARKKAEVEALVARMRVAEAHLVEQARVLRTELFARGYRNVGSHYTPSQQLRDVAAGKWI
ncbi:hypothetical protein ACFPPF_22020 [Xenophilus aerolatus]|nr:hypothetical protein [Xenophilus aerolatus]